MTQNYVFLMGKHPYTAKQFDSYLRKYPSEFDEYNKDGFTVISMPIIKSIFKIEKYWVPFWDNVLPENRPVFVMPDTPAYRRDMAMLLKMKFPTVQTPGAAVGFFDPIKKYALAFNYTGAVLHEMAHLNGFTHHGGQIY